MVRCGWLLLRFRFQSIVYPSNKAEATMPPMITKNKFAIPSHEIQFLKEELFAFIWINPLLSQQKSPINKYRTRSLNSVFRSNASRDEPFSSETFMLQWHMLSDSSTRYRYHGIGCYQSSSKEQQQDKHHDDSRHWVDLLK